MNQKWIVRSLTVQDQCHRKGRATYSNSVVVLSATASCSIKPATSTRPLFRHQPLCVSQAVCENSACDCHQLNGDSACKRTKHVLDMDRYYYIDWSDVVLRQLDPGHRSQFLIIQAFMLFQIG